MNLKLLSTAALTLSLAACASIPPPPHCEDNGKGLHPINPEMITDKQARIQRSIQQAKFNNHNPSSYPGNEGIDK